MVSAEFLRFHGLVQSQVLLAFWVCRFHTVHSSSSSSRSVTLRCLRLKKLTSPPICLQSPPNHVIPRPEEIYVYSPLGMAFKVKGSDDTSKNPSIVTMCVLTASLLHLRPPLHLCVITVFTVSTQICHMEHDDGHVNPQHTLGDKAGDCCLPPCSLHLVGTQTHFYVLCL